MVPRGKSSQMYFLLPIDKNKHWVKFIFNFLQNHYSYLIYFDKNKFQISNLIHFVRNNMSKPIFKLHNKFCKFLFL